MKVWKLVSGILSIILSVFVIFQSAAAGLSNSLEGNGEIGGSAGVLVALALLSGGIVSIVLRNKNAKVANLPVLIIFALGALFGFTMAGSYSDLRIWAAWCLICAVLALIDMKRKPKKNAENVAE